MLGFDCCCGDVLIWQANTGAPSGYSRLKAVYEAMDLTVHTNADWSDNLSNYGLIIWPGADSDPTWWGEITGNTWPGRLVITAEHSAFPGSQAYVNGLAALTGVSVVAASAIDSGCDHNGTVEADDLTAGQAVIKYAYTAELSGGTVLSRTVTDAKQWLARNKPGGSIIDFVVAGDINWLDDGCGAGLTANNTPLYQNLWNVPL